MLPTESVVGLEPNTSDTNGNSDPFCATYFMVPSNRGSLSSEYFSSRYSTPINMPTGPAGSEKMSFLLALKSHSVNSLSSLRYTSIRARSILAESIEKILKAAAVESANASVSRLLEILLLVRSSVVALE